MCITSPNDHKSRLQHLFETHPPLAQRIAVLEGMAQAHTV